MVRPGRAHAADRVLEQRVAGEDVALDEQRRACPAVCPGVCSVLHLEAADAHGLVGAPSSPVDAVDALVAGAIEHLQVGPALGSCGSSATWS